jgi:hemolysin activation/secretion protein
MDTRTSLYARCGRASSPKRALRVATASLALFAAHAFAQTPPPPMPTLPAGATVGGAQPQVSDTPLQVPEDAGPTFTIPPVYDRPLGVEEGDRVLVKGFVLHGIEDDLAAGIKTAEVEARVQARFDELSKLIEDLRVTRQNRDKIDADGFTAEEKAKVLSFIQNILSSVSADSQVEAYEQFMQGLRLQRLERDQGLTIGQMGLIAEEVTKYYRERGYFLARAVIPAQEVVGGIVTIRVLEGRLGEVIPEGNKRYSSEDVQAPFENFKGKMITVERVEDALLTLQAYPGMSASGVFRPGKVVGTADMVVNVQGERTQDWLVRFDNHGSRFTGSERLVADFTWNNPLHDADYLKLQAVQTLDPANSLFGSVRYEAKLDNPDNRWGFSMSNNTFDVLDLTTGLNSGINGVSKDANVYFMHQMTRTRTTKTSVLTEVIRKQGDTSSTGVLLSRDEEAVLAVQLDSEIISPASATISSMYLRVDAGFDGIMGVPSAAELGVTVPQYSRAGATGEFTKLQAGYSVLKSLAATRSVLFRFNGQWTDDRLTSLEQFNIGGTPTVRAAPTSAALRDYGGYASVEYNTRGLWFGEKPAWSGRNFNQVLGVSAFYDYAVGLTNLLPAEPTDDTNRRLALYGPGVSLDMTLPWGIGMKVMYAHLNGGPKGAPANPGSIIDTNQTWFEFQKSF